MMQEFNIFEGIERVKAPEGFEREVLHLLYERKKKRIKVRALRLSLTGALSTVAALIVVINFFVLPQRGPVDVSGLEGEIPAFMERGISPGGMETIPIIERVDYSQEIRPRRQEPPTIFLLEQCSDKTNREIKY
jgi:hypothetical protein